MVKLTPSQDDLTVLGRELRKVEFFSGLRGRDQEDRPTPPARGRAPELLAVGSSLKMSSPRSS